MHHVIAYVEVGTCLMTWHAMLLHQTLHCPDDWGFFLDCEPPLPSCICYLSVLRFFIFFIIVFIVWSHDEQGFSHNDKQSEAINQIRGKQGVICSSCVTSWYYSSRWLLLLSGILYIQKELRWLRDFESDSCTFPVPEWAQYTVASMYSVQYSEYSAEYGVLVLYTGLWSTPTPVSRTQSYQVLVSKRPGGYL